MLTILLIIFKIILGIAFFLVGWGFRKGYRSSVSESRLTMGYKIRQTALLYAGWLFMIVGILILYNAIF
jgi:uncharacterized membrane protein YphA (DoxX/SURF4 family)